MLFCSTPRSRSDAGRRAVWTAVAALCLSVILLSEHPVSAGAPSYAVIVSPDVGLVDLSVDELRRILTFKRTLWKTGQTINLLLPGAPLPARTFLLQRMYRMSDDELRRFILERLFQAEIDFAPKVVTSEHDAIAFVASGRSQIAIVSSDVHDLSKVKVLRVDGRLPGEAGYPLQ
jgi:hypothetical protein